MLIERIDGAGVNLPYRRPSRAEADALFKKAADGLLNQVCFLHQFALNWREALPLNELAAPAVGPADAGYFPGQFNTKCRWKIARDEALLITVDPSPAAYQSFDLGHPLWFNSIYPRELTSSLTGAQSRLSSDGRRHYVISASDPGLHNWLDTGGLFSGFLFVRWQRVVGRPPGAPQVKLMPVSDIWSALPDDEPRIAPIERAEISRTRRLALDRRYF